MNHAVKLRTTHGFTIIELMLSMTFVSVLMVMIALTVMQIANIYNKGTTMRAVDQAGRSVSADIQTTVAASQPLDIGSDGNGGMNFRLQTHVGGDINNPDGGRLCTGSYSYIWNTGSGLKNPVNRYAAIDDQIRLVKVRDTGALYCSDTTLSVNKSDATELLSSGDRELSIQSLRIVPAASDPITQQALYLVKLEIGTSDEASLSRAVTLNSIDTTCKPPSDKDSQQDFCAVNKFEFSVRTGTRGV